ncbi:SAP domain-containing ribonucleoprotein isoform 3-T3 [Amazona ochrocephala]
MERMQKRAERFNVPVSLESKKAARAARFGLAMVSTKGLSSDSKPTVNMDKLKERAQRFGLNVSSLSKKGIVQREELDAVGMETSLLGVERRGREAEEEEGAVWHRDEFGWSWSHRGHRGKEEEKSGTLWDRLKLAPSSSSLFLPLPHIPPLLFKVLARSRQGIPHSCSIVSLVVSYAPKFKVKKS